MGGGWGDMASHACSLLDEKMWAYKYMMFHYRAQQMILEKDPEAAVGVRHFS